ncbi:MAG: hypothetical protein DMF80_13790 [Acidobacteria bacterium]|nr:MAG: hypothetical protein DMF80_13790 [Acidobacteriota bacterium]
MKAKIAQSFYPQGEKPVDFLEAHPMKADIERMAAEPAFARVEEFLDGSERERVVALGGLHILATERHEARRIDNQLRGRAGRQGDPGSSRFYLSLEDDLMRIFGSDRISGAWSPSRSSARRGRWRRRTSPSASTCSSTTT